MKKILLFIVGILLITPVNAYNVILHYNGSTEVIPIEGNTSITLDGDWSESNDNYIYNNSYTYTDIYYIDGYGRNKTERVVSDIYFNGDYELLYTGNQYTLLKNNQCGSSFTGYTPTFDITGNITDISTGNIFNNFAENSLEVLLSNIPNYIQYVIMVVMLLFIIGLFRKFR